MKFALVDGERFEAQPGLSGKCPGCEHPMVAKCGEIKIWHWAHLGTRTCDPWWENETKWHRDWKEQFPREWQEQVHRAESGEKHIEDVKTDQGWLLEFQHSYLNPAERPARNAFHPRLSWVLDGTRRARDKSQFINALNSGVRLNLQAPVARVPAEKCALFREWAGNSPVFFDFGEDSTLWYLLPKSSDGNMYIAKFSRPNFIELYLGGAQMVHDIDFLKDFGRMVSDFNSRSQFQR